MGVTNKTVLILFLCVLKVVDLVAHPSFLGGIDKRLLYLIDPR